MQTLPQATQGLSSRVRRRPRCGLEPALADTEGCIQTVHSVFAPPGFRYYADSSTGQCEKCHRSCKACQGPRPTDCLSCDEYFFLLRSKGECSRACPEHHYAEQSTRTCERCHPTCQECRGERGGLPHTGGENGKVCSSVPPPGLWRSRPFPSCWPRTLQQAAHTQRLLVALPSPHPQKPSAAPAPLGVRAPIPSAFCTSCVY